jgi:hypothetical protein
MSRREVMTCISHRASHDFTRTRTHVRMVYVYAHTGVYGVCMTETTCVSHTTNVSDNKVSGNPIYIYVCIYLYITSRSRT